MGRSDKGAVALFDTRQEAAGPRRHPFPSARPIDAARTIDSISDASPWESLDADFGEFELVCDMPARVLWQYMKPVGRPSFTVGMLDDIAAAQRRVTDAFAACPDPADFPVRYTVFASRIPGIFNLGGDLPLFAELIRQKDREGLRRYAYACVEPQYRRATNLNLPAISISLVQGDALGGGFECALADDVIIAERSAKFGLPEILFNLFPGMGAYSFLSRKVGAVQAESMILSGRIYSAEELYEIGLVEMVADDGAGQEAVYDFIERHDRGFGARQAVYRARRVVSPVELEELRAVTDLWVDTAVGLDPADLRKMERLAAAQDRRLASRAKSG